MTPTGTLPRGTFPRALRGPLPETEEGFLGWVTDYARRRQWLRYHTRRSKGSDAGFPDLVLIRPPRLVVAELKLHPASQKRGRPTAPQVVWLEAFRECGVEWHVWRPGDRDEIVDVLR